MNCHPAPDVNSTAFFQSPIRHTLLNRSCFQS